MGIVVITNGRFHGDGLFGNFQNLTNLVFRHFHLHSKLGRIWLTTGLLKKLTRDTVHLVDGFDHVNRDTDGAGLVCNGTRNGLTNPPGCVGGELVASTVFKLVDCLH